MSRECTFFSILLAGLAILFCAGCIALQEHDIPAPHTLQPATATATAALPSPSPDRLPVMVQSPVPPAPADIPAESPPPVETTPTWIPKTYGRDSVSDPQIVLLTFARECFIFDIPDCAMRELFPAAAGDPGYGIRRPVPKLVMIPDTAISAFLRANAGRYADDPNPQFHIDANTLGGTACSGGAPGTPKWNFVRVNITLMPRNARPGEYDIGLNIRSRGVVVTQLRESAWFEIDRPVIIARYIPLTLDEMEFFDSIDLAFARRS